MRRPDCLTKSIPSLRKNIERWQRVRIEQKRKNIKPVIPIENHAVEIREIYRSLVSDKNEEA